MDKVITHSNRFSIKLFKRVSSLDARSSVCLCPFAVFHSLAMAYAGAQGNTELQMAKAFKVNKKYDIHSGFQELLTILQRAHPDVRQELACHVFLERTFRVVPAYESLLTDKYRADVHRVDMREEPEAVRNFVNNTVESTTAGSICQLLVAGVTDHDSKILFYNSISFKASWEHPFPTVAAVTERNPFTFNRNDRSAELVVISGPYRHYRDNDMKVLTVEVPLKSGQLSIVLFVADNVPSLRRFHKHLSIDLYQKLLSELGPAKDRISVHVPKLKTEETVQPSYSLKHMGFVDLFDEHADLGGAGKGLFVSDIMHKVTLHMDSTGVSASAASSVSLTDYYTEELPKAYRDVPNTRPFIYVVKNRETDLILFMGAVQDL